MGKAAEARQVIGAVVHAKAAFITNFSECSRLCGAAAASKLVRGCVEEAVCKTVNDRRLTSLVVRWYFLGRWSSTRASRA